MDDGQSSADQQLGEPALTPVETQHTEDQDQDQRLANIITEASADSTFAYLDHARFSDEIAASADPTAQSLSASYRWPFDANTEEQRANVNMEAIADFLPDAYSQLGQEFSDEVHAFEFEPANNGSRSLQPHDQSTDKLTDRVTVGCQDDLPRPSHFPTLNTGLHIGSSAPGGQSYIQRSLDRQRHQLQQRQSSDFDAATLWCNESSLDPIATTNDLQVHSRSNQRFRQPLRHFGDSPAQAPTFQGSRSDPLPNFPAISRSDPQRVTESDADEITKSMALSATILNAGPHDDNLLPPMPSSERQNLDSRPRSPLNPTAPSFRPASLTSRIQPPPTASAAPLPAITSYVSIPPWQRRGQRHVVSGDNFIIETRPSARLGAKTATTEAKSTEGSPEKTILMATRKRRNESQDLAPGNLPTAGSSPARRPPLKKPASQPTMPAAPMLGASGSSTNWRVRRSEQIAPDDTIDLTSDYGPTGGRQAAMPPLRDDATPPMQPIKNPALKAWLNNGGGQRALTFETNGMVYFLRQAAMTMRQLRFEAVNARRLRDDVAILNARLSSARPDIRADQVQAHIARHMQIPPFPSAEFSRAEEARRDVHERLGETLAARNIGCFFDDAGRRAYDRLMVLHVHLRVCLTELFNGNLRRNYVRMELQSYLLQTDPALRAYYRVPAFSQPPTSAMAPSNAAEVQSILGQGRSSDQTMPGPQASSFEADQTYGLMIPGADGSRRGSALDIRYQMSTQAATHLNRPAMQRSFTADNLPQTLGRVGTYADLNPGQGPQHQAFGQQMGSVPFQPPSFLLQQAQRLISAPVIPSQQQMSRIQSAPNLAARGGRGGMQQGGGNHLKVAGDGRYIYSHGNIGAHNTEEEL